MSSNERLIQALLRLFDRYRIVFWYDSKQELRGDFEALLLPGVEKLELNNNEYGIKYRILREQPEHKFLLYKEGDRPPDLDNWLLDVELAQGEFRTDQGALWLSEMELGLDFLPIVQAHAEFFQAAKRREALKSRLRPDDTAGLIRLKMLAVCVGADPRMDAIIEQLLADLLQSAGEAEGEKFRLAVRYGLGDYFWEQLKRHYGYASSHPSLRDFAIQLFKDGYFQHFADGNPDALPHLASDALVFLKRWKDSRQFEACFEALSHECAAVLAIEQDLQTRDFRELIELDFFRLIDVKIISDLVKAIAQRTVSSGDVALWVRQRRQGHWYGDFRSLYEALDCAAQFIGALGEAQLGLDSLTDGVTRYRRNWFRLDQLYRKFILNVRASSQPTLMGDLSEQIENLYTNNFLLKLNDRWQALIDEMDAWQVPDIPLQRQFFERWVRPFLNKDNKVCVIISDAMRYEIGDELMSLIRQEDRYGAELETALSMLPSYTQLGMAALLPNKTLALADNENGTVLVDGQSSLGTVNRARILKAATQDRAEAMTSDDFMALNRDANRELLKSCDLLYLYHNRIDHTGDKILSEGQVFEAVQQTLDDLIKLVKKLTAANASNILITADHGFIYQDRTLDESDFSGVEAEGDSIFYRDRRFVIGKGLKPKPGLRHFTAAQLGLSGEQDFQIPKSINRLRLKGSGSRFVHGGATLQEVVIPVIRINKKRQSDISVVDVTILQGASKIITSGQLAVAFYQEQPATEKIRPRVLRAGLYTESGELISDSHVLSFDLASGNPRERELQIRFLLTRKADEANGRDVILRLDEQHAGTSHYIEYKSLRYTLRRSFTSDFDF
jgi:uncharacterized protein (TIGR02687 family)